MENVGCRKIRGTKPTILLHKDLNNERLLKRLERTHQINFSTDLLPFSCHVASASFLLIDFSNYYQYWTENETFDEKKLAWLKTLLAKFVETSHGPNLVYLCPQIDELLTSVLYDIQKSIEVSLPHKVLNSGFASSWKAVADYIKETACIFCLDNMEEECITYSKGFNYIASLHKEIYPF